MAKISAHGTKFIYEDKEEIAVFYKVGTCKLVDKDIDTLLSLQAYCKENPSSTIDLRKTK